MCNAVNNGKLVHQVPLRIIGKCHTIEVRAGEVSKGQVARNSHIMSEAAKLVEVLGAGPGVITLQLFLSSFAFPYLPPTLLIFC